MVPLRYGTRTIQRILCSNAISHSQCTTKDKHARARMLNYFAIVGLGFIANQYVH